MTLLNNLPTFNFRTNTATFLTVFLLSVLIGAALSLVWSWLFVITVSVGWVLAVAAPWRRNV